MAMPTCFVNGSTDGWAPRASPTPTLLASGEKKNIRLEVTLGVPDHRFGGYRGGPSVILDRCDELGALLWGSEYR